MGIMSIFETGEAIRSLFQLGFLPQKDEYYELTAEQYERYYEDNGQTDEKVYMLLPKDSRKYGEVAANDVYVFSESDIALLDMAVEVIEKYCQKSDEKFNTFEDKLFYAANLMPLVFSEGTKFQKSKISMKINEKKIE